MFQGRSFGSNPAGYGIDRMKILRSLAVVALVAAGCSASDIFIGFIGLDQARDSLQKTGVAILAAFARGDLAAIMQYHHPDVIKALASNKYLVGHDAVKADAAETLERFHLEWVENRQQTMFVQGDSAVELTAFAIKSTPKNGGQFFLFKCRAMVVYVRYNESPTGWASIREVIQPESQ